MVGEMSKILYYNCEGCNGNFQRMFCDNCHKGISSKRRSDRLQLFTNGGRK